MTEFEIKVIDYLKADRQWPRAHRLNHAKMQHTKAANDMDRSFWQVIIERNED